MQQVRTIPYDHHLPQRLLLYWGVCGSLVESMPFVQRVMGSTPALAVGTLGESLTHSCLWRFGVKFRHSIRAVSGAPLSSSGLEEAL